MEHLTSLILRGFVTCLSEADDSILLGEAPDELKLVLVDPKMVERLEEAGGPNITRINLKGGGHWVPLDSIAGGIWQQWEAAEALAPGDTPTAP